MYPGAILSSPVTGTQYVLDRQLGAGGFGAAFQCEPLGGGRPLCIKLTMDQASWHREAYLAELLRRHPRVVAIFETFALQTSDGMTYAVVMELADRGTLADVLEESGPFSEARAVQELKGLLSAVERLHRSGAYHRDITPMNVFMCGNHLKLGDFGIARHGFGKHVKADMFNPWFVDPAFHQSKTRWTAGDDLWQLGQLVVGMLTGEIDPIRARDIRHLDCSDHLKGVLYRALGRPEARFIDAASMTSALKETEVRFDRVRSLDGVGVAFTGKLGVSRDKAKSWARRAGATIHDGISRQVDLVVVGGDSSLWVAGGSGGSKLLTVARLKEEGHPIKLIRESTFMRLVGR